MKIGKLIPVNLRDVWQKEEVHFSKWLAENIEALSDSLEINLEITGVEKKIDGSNFEIDVLCEDDDGNVVVIENQLEKTDHSHLGQVMTYLVNMEADVAIWISKEPRQEHINVFNWLNEISDKSFYLVKVEAYKIDESAPAPFFTVLSKPSGEMKKIGEDKKIIQSERNIRRKRRELSDTIIVPARSEGFDRVFIGENCWYSIRIKESKIPDLKYIAGYQVAPISAITHVAEIKEIVRSPKDPTKYKVIFKAPAQKINPIKIGSRSKVQGPAYCEYSRIKTARTVDDLLGDKGYGEDAA